MKLALEYAFLCKDRDRHGNVRYYFRRNAKKIRIRARAGSLEFQTEYEALSGACTARPQARLPASGERPRESDQAFVSLGLDDEVPGVRRNPARDVS